MDSKAGVKELHFFDCVIYLKVFVESGNISPKPSHSTSLKKSWAALQEAKSLVFNNRSYRFLSS